jgi:Tol biopolymer transport system component/DNA-binding winged helix-turn-helix (wHTH) protein
MHHPAREGSRIRFGSYELDVVSGELRKGPTRLKVPAQSIQILAALLERPGELVTREQLRERLWPRNTFVDSEHGLNAAMRRLRDALCDSADAPTFIETLPRRGYRFIGVVDGGAAPASTVVEPAPVLARPRWRRSQLAAIIAVLCAALAASLWLSRREGVEPAPASPLRSVPVTTFPGLEVDPAVSPDGNHVAFASDRNRGDNLDIYVMLIDGGGPIQLTTDAASERAPAWSPDGRRLAFLRSIDSTHSTIVVVPALGHGAERRLTDNANIPVFDPALAYNWLSWTPDGTAVVFVDRAPETGTLAIFRCSVDTGERRAVTPASREHDDASPAVSPDGRHLAFVRRNPGSLVGRIVLQELADGRVTGEPRLMTSDSGVSSVVWGHDGRHLFYDSGGRDDSRLWRVAMTGGPPQPILANARAARPSLSRDGKRLLYQLTTTDVNIWGAPIGRNGLAPGDGPVQVAASTSIDASPQFSPDGRRIAFVSMRSGHAEIWMARSDGADAVQATTFGGSLVGSPRWSPNGEAVAFDSTKPGTYNVYVMRLADGRVRAVTNDRWVNVRPSWSGDGRWIYFGSTRSGASQIWKIASAGGDPVQVTTNGGLEAFESPDGRHVYYALANGVAGIWQVPVDGGEERQIVPIGTMSTFAVSTRGIFVLRRSAPAPTVDVFDPATQQLARVTSLPAGTRLAPSSPGLAISRDGKSMLYVTYDQWGSDVHMLEGEW